MYMYRETCKNSVKILIHACVVNIYNNNIENCQYHIRYIIQPKNRIYRLNNMDILKISGTAFA